MKPEITVSTSDLERLEGLLSKPPTRNRSDLDGLRAELDRANILDTDGMPADVIMMNSRARFREETSGPVQAFIIIFPGLKIFTGALAISKMVFQAHFEFLFSMLLFERLSLQVRKGMFCFMNPSRSFTLFTEV